MCSIHLKSFALREWQLVILLQEYTTPKPGAHECYIVLFGPVKLELGVIPSGQKKKH